MPPSATFILGQQDSLLFVSCSNTYRTDDPWLSIVESIEFLNDQA